MWSFYEGSVNKGRAILRTLKPLAFASYEDVGTPPPVRWAEADQVVMSTLIGLIHVAHAMGINFELHLSTARFSLTDHLVEKHEFESGERDPASETWRLGIQQPGTPKS